jgi:transposase
MESRTISFKDKTVFIGLDLHKKTWNLTARSDGLQLKYWSMNANKELLRSSLHKFFPNAKCVVAYEAGCFGYWLYDYLTEHNITVIITPPNLIPKEDTTRVKNNRIDSRKLAQFAENGLLNKVAVPDKQIRWHRGVLRARRQTLRARKRLQLQIRSLLLFHGIDFEIAKGKWSIAVIEKLARLRFPDPIFEQSFQLTIQQLIQVRKKLTEQTLLLRQISRLSDYKKDIEILLRYRNPINCARYRILNRNRNPVRIAQYLALPKRRKSRRIYRRHTSRIFFR